MTRDESRDVGVYFAKMDCLPFAECGFTQPEYTRYIPHAQLVEVERKLAERDAEIERFNVAAAAYAIACAERDEAERRLSAYESPSCWHCGDCLEPEPPATHCERCPKPGDCDDEECECKEKRCSAT